MCGIVGIIGNQDAATEAYHGLLMLQHRGQDSAGLLSYDLEKKHFNIKKNLGLVDQVFNEDEILKLKGSSAIGHTRYSTIGKIIPEDIQPMLLGYPFGIGIAHNGNIINFKNIKDHLYQEKKRAVFSNNDLEAILHLLASEISEKIQTKRLSPKIVFDAIRNVITTAEGGVSAVSIIGELGLVAFKDPNGIRPLILGRKENPTGGYSYCFASESTVLNFLNYQVVRDLSPGEAVIITNDGQIHSKDLTDTKQSPCMFEWIYFANAESTILGKNIYQVRLELGKLLSKEVKKDLKNLPLPDMIVPVPDTSRPSAISLAEELNLPYREILIKNRYIQRSFILNNQKLRDNAVKLKLNAVKEQVVGKNILLVDDSIVRGTTSKRIIQMLKEAGAKNIYFASTCPPITSPCFYGIDFPKKEELIAFDKNKDQIAKSINAQKVIYLELEKLKDAIGLPDFCHACLSGKYPTSIDQSEIMIANRVKKSSEDEIGNQTTI